MKLLKKFANVFCGGVFRAVLVSILALSSLAACETLQQAMGTATGNPLLNNKALVNKLVKGKTTMADTKRLLGEPQGTEDLNNGDTEWGYSRGQAEGFTGIKSITLTLVFDKNKVLKKKDYSVTHSAGAPSGSTGDSDSTGSAGAASNGAQGF